MCALRKEMNFFMNKNRISVRFKKSIEEYIKNNFNNYILVILFLIIGVFAGIVVINNFSDEKKGIINNYMISFFDKFNNINGFDQSKLLLYAILNDCIITIILFISGTTILGMPIVLGVILYRGFCLSYTISSITLSIGFNKSLLFCAIALFLPSLLFIPAILTIAVSSLRLYKSIVHEKNKEIIKMKLLSHFIITIMMFCVLLLASVVENYISLELIKLFKEYFISNI